MKNNDKDLDLYFSNTSHENGYLSYENTDLRPALCMLNRDFEIIICLMSHKLQVLIKQAEIPYTFLRL